jgi:hypothetical protein
MEVEQALADLAEVRERLASCQQFRGYSSIATAFSGVAAVAAGLVQSVVAPQPVTEAQVHLYLSIWLICLACALASYYGSLAVWYMQNAGLRARSQTKSAGLAILPGLALGAVLTVALLLHNVTALLPGIWYACYGVALLASRAMVPRGVMPLAVFFGLAGAALLLLPDPQTALVWWIMPLGFGLGQIYIGWLLKRDDLQTLENSYAGTKSAS